MQGVPRSYQLARLLLLPCAVAFCLPAVTVQSLAGTQSAGAQVPGDAQLGIPQLMASSPASDMAPISSRACPGRWLLAPPHHSPPLLHRPRAGLANRLTGNGQVALCLPCCCRPVRAAPR
uniref:Uncharacterized protein n=1 Tax=Chlamydomonas leiostraca TaxID=1034604 RepID=A0A7S0RD58_9CHLO